MKKIIALLITIIAFVVVPSTSKASGISYKINTALLVDSVATSPFLHKTEEPIKVGLVLCGGGAKGAAHIGVLKRLEELGIRPDLIVGTSMGALVGGMYAMGYTADQLDSIVINADWDFLLSDGTKRADAGFTKKKNDDVFLMNIPFYSLEQNIKNKEEISIIKNLPGGFIQGSNVLNLLNGLAIGYQDSIDFKQLPIPFACIATDLSNGKEVILDKGHLPLALRASMAIPGYFSPVEIDGRVLVDGGVVNNFPVDVARQMGATVVIGVDVQTDLYGPDQLKSIDAVLMQLIGLLGNEKFIKNKEDVDIYLKPDVSKFGTLSFDTHSVTTLVANGYKEADDKSLQLKSLASKLSAYHSINKGVNDHKAQEIYKSKFKIDKIQINGVTEKEKKKLLALSGLRDSSIITGEQINRTISLFNGTKAFSNVTYNLSQADRDADNANSLTFNLVKGPTNILSVGARYDTEEAAALLLHLGINQYTLSGSKFNITSRLGYNPYVKLGYTYVFQNFPRLEIEYQFSSKDLNIYSGKSSTNNIEFMLNSLDVAFANITYFRFIDGRIGAKWHNFKFNKFLTDNKELTSFYNKSRQYLSVYAEGVIDTKDDKTFPTEGTYINASIAYYYHAFHSYFHRFLDALIGAEWFIDMGSGFNLSPKFYSRTAFNNKSSIAFFNFVGGVQPGRYVSHQLPFIGMSYATVFENSVSIFRTDFRKQFGKKHFVYLMVNYMREAEKLNKIFSGESNDYFGVGLQYSYNSPLGPLSLNVSWSDYKRKLGASLSLGYFF